MSTYSSCRQVHKKMRCAKCKGQVLKVAELKLSTKSDGIHRLQSCNWQQMIKWFSIQKPSPKSTTYKSLWSISDWTDILRLKIPDDAAVFAVDIVDAASQNTHIQLHYELQLDIRLFQFSYKNFDFVPLITFDSLWWLRSSELITSKNVPTLGQVTPRLRKSMGHIIEQDWRIQPIFLGSRDLQLQRWPDLLACKSNSGALVLPLP